MARINCKYHPQVPARWHCPSCSVNVCSQCVKQLGPPQNTPACHTCRAELSSLGMANVIPPFWERIPRFFLYPAKTDSLLYLGALALGSILAFIPFFGLLIYLFITYAILKYAYLILNHTARGNLSPPEVLSTNLTANHALPLKQLAVFFVMGLLVVGASMIAPPLAIVFVLFMMFSIPASVMSLAINGSIVQAVNPIALADIIRRIGWPYLILYVFLLLLSGGSTLTQAILEQVLPEWLTVIALTFVSAYFTVIMFNMMGYVVYQYHEALGFEEAREFDSCEAPASQRAPAVTDPFQNELNILINEGKIDEAKDRLRKKMRVSATPFLHDQYHKLLQLSKDVPESTRHGQEYVKILLNAQELTKASEIYGECLRLDPEFRFPDGRKTYRLAEFAHDKGKHDLALRLLNKFSQRYPEHADTPRAYLLAAKILCEYKSQDGQARTVLDSLIRRYPDHPLAGEIKSYRSFVDRLDDAGRKLADAGA